MGCVRMCSLTFRNIFSLGSISKRDKKSAVIIIPGVYGMVKLNLNAKLQAFQKGGGISFVWKNLVTHLLSVMLITGLVAP